MSKIKNLGQYFTKNNDLRTKVKQFILNKPKVILEPSVGQGDLISAINDENIKFDMYEIDNEIPLLDNIPTNVIYKNFLEEKISKKYKTIVGNPPYVRTKNGNLYIDFIDKCFDLLQDDGELIFIIPSDFFKLSSSCNIIKKMMTHGSFTHIFHPESEKLFENASINVICFRYCKNSSLEKIVLYNDEKLYCVENKGMLLFNKNDITNKKTFGDYFDIYVGLVSGKESVFKNEKHGNINILNGENVINKYIFIDKYPCNESKINNYLESHKNSLLSRKIKKFNDKNWFEWGAPRNMDKMVKPKNLKCIYIYNLTRRNNVAFIDKLQYFGGNLILLKPKKDCNLEEVCKYLNSYEFKRNFTFSKRFKIGHKQIKDSYIPNII